MEMSELDKSGIEVALFLDNKDNIIEKIEGDECTIDVPGSKIEELLEKGAVKHIHNHPTGGSFTDYDVRLWKGFKECSVVGKGYMYTVRPVEKVFTEISRIQKEFIALLEDYEKNWTLANLRRMTFLDYAEHAHFVWQKVKNIIYEKRKL